jgi:hypothetical protein
LVFYGYEQRKCLAQKKTPAGSQPENMTVLSANSGEIASPDGTGQMNYAEIRRNRAWVTQDIEMRHVL